MGRHAPSLDDYLEWQQRLRNHEGSGLSVQEFRLQEGLPRGSFYRWLKRLEGGIPVERLAEHDEREPVASGDAPFLPVTLQAAPVEVELPNGARVRLPVGLGQVALLAVLRLVGDLPPRRPPTP